MKGFAFAYVVQLDLPGGPVKIGRSARPRSRFKQFELGTPVNARLVGITFDGYEREAEMLAATADRTIKGEWRYPTRELYRLISKYHSSGEWFVPAVDHQAHFDAADVEARVHRIIPKTAHPVSPSALNYFWSKEVLAAVTVHDRMIPVDWAGFTLATDAPSLSWPEADRKAA
ncbi:hypothetical protein [Sphingopyxis macrogoltabida]|uniref:GIY-YIG nuclease family protein n=1 Tax=Sphingopyxis macrogoltabida TaxID=33050 RepID=A0AAC8Z157_SPHMC|nr:hypothetical protein [Sphingopyxis macrogoltabida]ALJ12608.1 hypothetical protein LH19_06990 [Sphingopyxis macrogoltabida]AMU89921.1 hypothetical protein ATM17_12830 [Sphingopyxis macrogoltabida]